MMNTHPQQRTAFLSIWILFSAIIMGNVNCDARVVSTDESTCDSDQCISDSSEITVDGINGEKQLKDIGGIETQVGGGTNECALYLAQSSIPNAGIGMYTAIDLKKGDTVGDPELLITVADFDEKRFPNGYLVDDITWSSDLSSDFYMESLLSENNVYPGFGAAVNCHMGLNNVVHDTPQVDSAGLHRKQDPGAGAFTYFHNIVSEASVAIPAGSELFVDYGQNWFDTRSYMGQIPYEKDFIVADRILRTVENELLGSAGKMEGVSDIIREATWNLIRRTADARVGAALPQKLDHLSLASSMGSARFSTPNSVRSLEWLKENGVCGDHIYPANSTITQAGRGAFARRLLRKGDVVAPAPVLQIDRDTVILKEARKGKEGVAYLTDNVVGQQLLVNYCFGHPKSNILLLPYGPTTGFINHNRQKANVRIRWSESALKCKDGFLSRSSKEILKSGFGLVMEYVATRDIHPRDEVFVDYGTEWEDAWKKHEDEYVPPEGAEGYVSAHDMILRLEDYDILTRVEQKETNAYPINVMTACHYAPIEQNENDMEEVQWEPHVNHANCKRPCQILATKRDKNGKVIKFDARILGAPFLWENCEITEGDAEIVTGIPREWFTFMDRVYTKDQYMRNAFRHYMVLPDDVLPKTWRNDE